MELFIRKCFDMKNEQALLSILESIQQSNNYNINAKLFYQHEFKLFRMATNFWI